MPSFDVAHIRQQGQNMLLFPLSSSFGSKSDADKTAVLSDLERHAHGAGLAGSAAVIWESGGRARTYGPTRWSGFLSSISMQFVLTNVNKKISW